MIAATSPGARTPPSYTTINPSGRSGREGTQSTASTRPGTRSWQDPEGIVWMRGYLGALAGQGCAVLVSSHLMSEVEDAADHLVVAGRGQVIAATEPGVLEISNLSSERIVALLTEHTIPFTEAAVHRSTVEEAYLELTREAAEFRAAEAAS